MDQKMAKFSGEVYILNVRGMARSSCSPPVPYPFRYRLQGQVYRRGDCSATAVAASTGGEIREWLTRRRGPPGPCALAAVTKRFSMSALAAEFSGEDGDSRHGREVEELGRRSPRERADRSGDCCCPMRAPLFSLFGWISRAFISQRFEASRAAVRWSPRRSRCRLRRSFIVQLRSTERKLGKSRR